MQIQGAGCGRGEQGRWWRVRTDARVDGERLSIPVGCRVELALLSIGMAQVEDRGLTHALVVVTAVVGHLAQVDEWVGGWVSGWVRG